MPQTGLARHAVNEPRVGIKKIVPTGFIRARAAQALSIKHGLEVIETSALSDYNVEQAFQMLAEGIHRKLPAQPRPLQQSGGQVGFGMSLQGEEGGSCC